MIEGALGRGVPIPAVPSVLFSVLMFLFQSCSVSVNAMCCPAAAAAAAAGLGIAVRALLPVLALRQQRRCRVVYIGVRPSRPRPQDLDGPRKSVVPFGLHAQRSASGHCALSS